MTLTHSMHKYRLYESSNEQRSEGTQCIRKATGNPAWQYVRLSAHVIFRMFTIQRHNVNTLNTQLLEFSHVTHATDPTYIQRTTHTPSSLHLVR